MKLPNADNAIVERNKITGYLLNPGHFYGSSKARFLGKFGFTAAGWEQLRESLLTHGRTHDVAKLKETGFGPRFSVEGVLLTPDGRNPFVRTVWQMDEGEVAPRLLTAYPVDQ